VALPGEETVVYIDSDEFEFDCLTLSISPKRTFLHQLAESSVADS